MKLISAQVTNFKSIDDSQPVEVDKVTCLVGKNESGKTAFLQALRKINPVLPKDREFSLLDFPRKGYTKYKRIHETQPATVVKADFTLSDEEVQEIESAFGKEVMKSRNVSVNKNYKNEIAWELEINNEVAFHHIVTMAEILPDVVSSLQPASNYGELVELLQTIADKPPSLVALLAQITPKVGTDIRDEIIKKFLEKFLPKFFYFDDYSIMNGRISIQYLRKRKDGGEILTSAESTLLALLALAGIDLKDLETESNYEYLKAELEAASISITDEVFKFWTQNRQLRVEFDLSSANPSDLPPLNSGTILHTRIWNERHQVSVPFDERSRGFVWFFSFLAYFSELEIGDSDLVLLLDEPGLNLHAKAQGDFLRFIDERLAPKHQVIYTTHSPFMIDATQLQRVRTVQDVNDKGTVISKDVLRNDNDTIFPLQAALGYDLAQTLFVGPNCLLVEGSSDLIYLQVLSEACAMKGKTSLDSRWVIVPAAGGAKISTFVLLLGANQLNIAILMDGSTRETQRIQQLASEGLIDQTNLIQVDEITGTKGSDIEDIFAPDYYLTLVNEAYEAELGRKIDSKLIGADANPRIIKRIENYFKSNEVGSGEFSHLRPALRLLQEQTKFIKDLDSQTIERASLLFQRINSLIPS